MICYLGTLTLRISGCAFSAKWLIIWLWIELKSLALIPILTWKVTPRSIEATSKYFLFNAIGRVFLLLGVLIRAYGSGSLLIGGPYKLIEIRIIVFALTMKVGVFPKHFWFIDVMQGVKFYAGFFVAIVSKIVPLYIIVAIRKEYIFVILKVVGVISVVIGSIFGVQQTQLRKLIALSSVTHLGWMIILFASTKRTWLGAALYFTYVIMVTPLFWVGELYSIEHLTKSTKIARKRTLTMTLCLTILSMAGFPPLLGFFYKWLMFLKIASAHRYLVIAGLIIARLISLYYYIQICIGFYINSWPTIKSVVNRFYRRRIQDVVTGGILVLIKVFYYFFFMVITPLVTSGRL